MCASWNSDMLMVIMFCSPPYSASASASAVSVLPTPEGPQSMNTPIGLLGLSSCARLVSMRLAIIFSPCDLPDDAPVENIGEVEHGLHLVLDHAADRNAGPVGDDGRHRLFVDMGVDHALLGIDRFQRGKFLLQVGACNIGILLRIGENVAQAADFADQFLFAGPGGIEVFEFFLQPGRFRYRSRRSAYRSRRRDRCR